MTNIKATNITWHEGHVGREERERMLKQNGALVWTTGLSGSGKSTIAYTLEPLSSVSRSTESALRAG